MFKENTLIMIKEPDEVINILYLSVKHNFHLRKNMALRFSTSNIEDSFHLMKNL